MPRRAESPDFSRMVAVASGTGPRVDRWASALTRAHISAAVTRPLNDDGRDYAELWVRTGDADEARAVMQDAGYTDECPLW